MDGQIELSRPQTAVNRSRTPLTLDIAGQRGGKSQMIGIKSGFYITQYPLAKGFIAANTYLQLTQSTLQKVFEIWRDLYKMTEYHDKRNPAGHFVQDRQPPAHWPRTETFKNYNNVISFWNGGIIYVGSLDNYAAHDGKEFCWCDLDETKDTKQVAVTSVILARLSQRVLFVDPETNEIVYIPKPALPLGKALIFSRSLRSFNPCWIHTSPAIGQVDWLVKMFDLDKHEPEIKKRIQATLPNGKPDFFYHTDGQKTVVIYSTYHNEKNLPENYIEGRKAVLTQKEQMKFIYGYPFSKTGGEYFPHFQRSHHVTKVPYIPGLPSHVSWDFNVVPYMTLICHQILNFVRYIDYKGDRYELPSAGRVEHTIFQIRVYREYCLASPKNTVEKVGEEYHDEHKEQPNNGIFYYGDSSGLSRIPGLGSLTNFKQVEMYMHRYLHATSKRVRPANMGIFARRDIVNKMFEGKLNRGNVIVEYFIDDSCEHLIADFENVKEGPNGKLKEIVRDVATGQSYQKYGHTSDAEEYFLCEILKAYIRD